MIDYKYFMDEIKQYEIHLLLEYIPYNSRLEMERTRMLMYSITAPYFKKGQRKSLHEFLPLPCDELEREKERLDVDEVNKIRNFLIKQK